MKEFSVAGAPHTQPQNSVGRIMRQVVYGLVPALAIHVGFFGPGIILQVLLACAFALIWEALALRARKQAMRPFLTDGSALVTAMLFVLCLPPLMPWWTVAVGTFFAIVVAKHAYGGLGYNVFNPAMVGYVVVLISFPDHATRWLFPSSLLDSSVSLSDATTAILFGELPIHLTWDAISQATPLDTLKTETGQGFMVTEISRSPIFGAIGGTGWEWIALAYLLGGLFLLWQRVITWEVPVALIATLATAALPLYLLAPQTYLPPLQQLAHGGILLGAFFIATDPVSGCTTSKGRVIFGAGVALITIAIRAWGNYPDGIAFGVLIMNMAAPLIDRYTQPRVFGRSR